MANRLTFQRFSRSLIGLAAWPGGAEAHSLLGVSHWWDGSFHLLLAPLAVAGLIATAAACSRLKTVEGVGSMFALALGVLIGVMVAPFGVSQAAPAGAVLMGGLAALGIAPRSAWGGGLCGVAGLSVGIAASIGERLSFELGAGAAFAALVIGAYGYFLLGWIARRSDVVPRVAGAWCAAVGLMMGLLTLVR